MWAQTPPAAGTASDATAGALDQRPIGVLFNGRAVVPGQYLGRLKDQKRSSAQSPSPSAAELPTSVGVSSSENLRTGGWTVLRPGATASRALVAATAANREAKIKADLAALMATGLYDYVEPDYLQYAYAVPSDTAFADGTLWGLRNEGQNGGVAGADIDVVRAWDLTTGSSAVVVGIIDTGLRYTHQELAAQAWTNSGEIAGDGIDNDGNGYVDDVHGINAITGSGDPMDDNGHGTHCAGTIGASANDAGPIVGVCWNVRLMGLKFLNSGGSGATSDAIKCIEYALSQGVRILSNSWGGGGYSQALYDAILAARDQGCLFVAAAGNAAFDTDRYVNFPSCYAVDNIVAVAALDRTDSLAGFTNTGLTTVDIGAPGVDIFSSLGSGDTAYTSMSGTSMATPHVSGVAALILAHYPGLSLEKLRHRLIGSSRPVESLRGYSAAVGAVDAYNALTMTADGTLDVRASANLLPLPAGRPADFFLTVSDLAPVVEATVTGTIGTTALTFLDDGVAPDRVAGDGIYSARTTVPTGSAMLTLAASATAPGKTAYSGSFTFGVGVPPANDDFAAATVVPAGADTQTGTNANSSEETGEPKHAGLGAGRSVWWSWTSPVSGIVTITTAGSGFDTILAVYTGDAVGALTWVGANNNALGTAQSVVDFVATAGTTYRIAVDSRSRAMGSVVLHLPISALPLPTNDNFANAVVLAGSNVAVTGSNLTATKETGEPNHAANPGAGSVWWTWTAPASGAMYLSTSGSDFDTLLAVYTGESVSELTEIASNDEAASDNTSALTFSAVAGTTYRIAVDGWYGSRGIVRLGLGPTTPPANDNFANAQALSGETGSVTGTNRYATGETGEPTHVNANGTATSVWYSWTASANGYEQFDTVGSSFNTVLAVYSGNVLTSLTPVVSDDNSGGGTASLAVIPAVAGTTYRIAVGDSAYNRLGGDIVLNHGVIAAPQIDTQPASTTGTIGGTASFAVTASGTALRFQWYHNGAAIAGATGTTLSLTNLQLDDGGTYTVVVSNAATSVMSAPAYLTGVNPAPTVSAAPGVVTAASGASATFTVSADGVGPLVYQWRHFGMPIAGATGPSLTLTSVAMVDAGFYDVVVYDGLSQTISAAGQLVVTPASGYANTLRLDTSYAPLFENAWASIEDAAVATSGEVYVGGVFSTIAGQRRYGVAKFDAALALDPTFAPKLDGDVYAVLALPDGKVLIGGSFTRVGATPCGRLARLNADGSLDTTFANGSGFSGMIWSLARQSDGKILVGGNFYSVGGTACSNIARLNADGSLDATFGLASGPNSTVNALAVQSDGRVVIGGSFTSVAGTARNRIARLNAGGTLDTTFDPGTGLDSNVESLAIQSDGKILLGGWFVSCNGAVANRIVRLESTGSIDTTFATGSGFNSAARALTVLADGRIAVSGWFSSYNGANCSLLCVLTATGAVDAAFAPSSRPGGSAYTLVPNADGGFLAAGYFTMIGSATPCSGLARYSGTGALVASAAGGFRQSGTVAAVAPVADGKWIAAGSFGYVSGVARGNIARLNADGSLDTTFGTGSGFNSSVNAIVVQGDGRIVAGGYFSACNGVPRSYVARLTAGGALDTSFDPGSGFNSYVTALALQADGKTVAIGQFTSFNGTTRNRIARLGVGGDLDGSFNPGAGFISAPTAVVARRDGRIAVGGSFTTYNGTAANCIAPLSSSGSLDTGFATGTGFNSAVERLAEQAGGQLVAVGSFSVYNGTARGGVARLNPDGTLDTGFGGANGANSTPVRTVAAQGDGKVLLGGYFTAYAGNPRKYFARLGGDGLLDPAFTAFDLLGGGANAACFTDGGGLLVANTKAERDGISRGGLILLKPELSPAPEIGTQPANQTAQPGNTVVFSVTASGEAPLTYQWYKDGVAITGATGSTLTLANVQLADVATYTVRVTNSYGSVLSSGATLSGGTPAPAIVTQPADTVVTACLPVTLTVGVTGGAAPALQWRKLGSPISGATGTSLTLGAATMADAAWYDVVITDGLNVVTSRHAMLSVAPTSYGTTFRVDPTFAALFERDGAGIGTVAVDASGRSYVTGTFTRLGGERRDGFARVDAAGSLDAGFSPAINGPVTAVVPLGTSGWILVGGGFTEINGVLCAGLARLSEDGTTVDPTFQPAYRARSISRIVVQSDGKLLFVGGFSEYPHGQLLRLNADGSLDPTWAPAGTGAMGVSALAAQPDGKVVVGLSQYDGASANNIARLNADGTLDSGFAVGAGCNNSIAAFGIQADGRIVVLGYFSTFNGASINDLMRLNADGTLDSSFDVGSGLNSVGSNPTLLLQPDGKLVIGGLFDRYNGVTCGNLIRIDATGALESGFATAAQPSGAVTALAFDATNNRLVVGGEFSTVGSTATSGLAHYDLAGAVVHTITSGGRVGATVRAAIPTADGAWIVGGDFTYANGTVRNRIAKLYSDGSLASGFAVGSGFNGPVETLALAGDGKIIVGGSFTSFDGAPRGALARLNADGTNDSSFAIGAGFGGSASTNVLDVVLTSGGRIVVAGEFGTFDGASAKWITRLLPDGTRDPSFAHWSPDYFAPLGLAVDAADRILSGSWYVSFNNWAYGRVGGVRLLADGSLDSSFDPTTNGVGLLPWAVAVQPDGKFIVAGYSNSSAALRTSLARFNDDGSFDPSYGSATETIGSVFSIQLLADGRLLTTGGFNYGGGPRSVGRFEADGTPDSSFAAYDCALANNTIAFGRGAPLYAADGRILVPGLNGARTGTRQYGLVLLRQEGVAAPVIVRQPSWQTINLGAAATLGVAAVGEGALTYQWYRGESGDVSLPIGDATTAVYQTPALSAWGRYWVRVANSAGEVDSATVLVRVLGGTMTLPDWTLWGAVPRDQRGALDAPAGDGVSNLLKFALGVPPLDSAAAYLPTGGTYAEAGQPLALALLFTKNPGAQGIRYAMEVSADLITWTEAAGITETLGSNPDGTLLVRLREAAPVAASRRFARLKVELTP